jgi:hypothetical protein
VRREITVGLTRRQGKRTLNRRVLVRSLTLERFIELMDTAYSSVFAGLIRMGGQPTQAGVLRVIVDQPDLVCRLVEIVCPDEPPGFYKAWRSPNNNGRIFDAAMNTNDWTLIGTVVKPGSTAVPEISLEGGLILMCQHFAGLTPSAVYGMFVDHVIRTAEGLRQVAEREAGPPVKVPADLASLARIPGISVVH